MAAKKVRTAAQVAAQKKAAQASAKKRSAGTRSVQKFTSKLNLGDLQTRVSDTEYAIRGAQSRKAWNEVGLHQTNLKDLKSEVRRRAASASLNRKKK